AADAAPAAAPAASPAAARRKATPPAPPAAPPAAAIAAAAPAAKAEPAAARPALPAPVTGTMERRAPPRSLRARPTRRWLSFAWKLALGLAVAGIAVALQDHVPHVSRQGESTVLSQAGENVPAVILRGHKGPVTGVAFAGEGRWVVSVAGDATIKIWETASR